MNYTLISADSHMDMTAMPGDLWKKSASPSMANLVPQIVETKDGPRWMAEGMLLGLVGGLGHMFHAPLSQGKSKHLDSMYQAGFFRNGLRMASPELRLEDMLLDGIDAEVVYGIQGVGLRFKDPRVTEFVYQVYNSWAAEFGKAHPGRWAPLACISHDDPHAAALELRRAAKIGLKGADILTAKAVKPIWHRDWDVLWAAADECNMPISFHTMHASIRRPDTDAMAQEYKLQTEAVSTTLFQMGPCSESLAAMIFSGACDRFPGLRFVLAEGGVSWIPYLLDRMDEEYKDRYFHLNFSGLPSNFWFRQGLTTYQHELHLAEVLPLVGTDNVMWGSSYPHTDGVFPDSKQRIAEDLAGISEKSRRKVTRNNAANLYGFPIGKGVPRGKVSKP